MTLADEVTTLAELHPAAQVAAIIMIGLFAITFVWVLFR